jgi:hypothetical protein
MGRGGIQVAHQGGNFIEHFASQDPIPPNYDVWILLGWVANLDTVQKLPSWVLYSINVTGPRGYSWGSDFVASTYLWGEVEDFGDGTGMRWFYKELGKLRVGNYGGSTLQVVTHTIHDASGNTWHKVLTNYTFAFTVGT